MENKKEQIGFHYTVSMEQIEAHLKRTPEEIFQWIEDTYRFVYLAQTDEERNAQYIFKPNKDFRKFMQADSLS